MRLFISYAHVDKPMVRQLAEILFDGGHDVWFDHRLIAGKNWQTQLYEAIRDCDAFVYALTPESVSSEWCLWEFDQAVWLEKPIVPVLMQARTTLLPELTEIQYVDFSDGANPNNTARLLYALYEAERVSPVLLPPSPPIPIGIPPQAVTTTPNLASISQEMSYEIVPQPAIVSPIVSENLVRNPSQTITILKVLTKHIPSVYSQYRRVLLLGVLALLWSGFTFLGGLQRVESRYYKYLGDNSYNVGNYELAIERYSRAIELNSDYARAYNNRGIAYRNLGDSESAIEDYTRAIDLEPDDATAYNNRCAAKINVGEYDSAIEDCNRAIDLEPDDARAYNNRGIAYAEIEEYESALVDYIRAIELDPNLPTPHLGLGHVYYEQEQYRFALDSYRRYLDLVGDNPSVVVVDRVEELEACVPTNSCGQ